MSIEHIAVKTASMENTIWNKWSFRSRVSIYLKGKYAFIQFIDRDLMVTHIQVNVKELGEKNKKYTKETDLTIPMKYDTMTIRLIETNDEFTVLNILEKSFSNQPMPLIHDDKGFISLIPKDGIDRVRKGYRHRSENRPDLTVEICQSSYSGYKPIEGAREFASSIALAMQLYLDFVSINYLSYNRHGRYMSNSIATLTADIFNAMNKHDLDIDTENVAELVGMISNHTMICSDRGELLYDGDEFYY